LTNILSRRACLILATGILIQDKVVCNGCFCVKLRNMEKTEPNRAPNKRRRRLRAEERRESILNAANIVFGQRGYDTVRIDDVAAAAGVSKALIYEHFRSKQELYAELMNRAALEMLERIVGAGSAPDVSGPSRLEHGAAAGFSFVSEKPEAFQMFVRDVTDPEVAKQQAALRRGAVAAMVGLMEMEPPETRTGLERRNLEQLAEMVVGGFYALGEWWLRNRDTDVSELISIMISFMWLGLGRIQDGERWGLLAAGGNHVADAEHDLHGSLNLPQASR
jgi:AcrR family transcriptional regulator